MYYHHTHLQGKYYYRDTLPPQHLTTGTDILLTRPAGVTTAQADAQYLLTISAERAANPTRHGLYQGHVGGIVRARVTHVEPGAEPLTGQPCYRVSALAEGKEYHFILQADHHVRIPPGR